MVDELVGALVAGMIDDEDCPLVNGSVAMLDVDLGPTPPCAVVRDANDEVEAGAAATLEPAFTADGPPLAVEAVPCALPPYLRGKGNCGRPRPAVDDPVAILGLLLVEGVA